MQICDDVFPDKFSTSTARLLAVLNHILIIVTITCPVSAIGVIVLAFCSKIRRLLLVKRRPNLILKSLIIHEKNTKKS